MQNEQELPRGFKKLSERYPMFPFLLGNGKSLREMLPRPAWRWKPKAWFVAQIEEATDRKLPLWFSQINKWTLVLIDGRKFPLTDEEKEVYMQALRVHDLAVIWSIGAEKMQNAHKTGVG